MIADSVEQPIRHRAATEFENMGLVSFVDIHSIPAMVGFEDYLESLKRVGWSLGEPTFTNASRVQT